MLLGQEDLGCKTHAHCPELEGSWLAFGNFRKTSCNFANTLGKKSKRETSGTMDSIGKGFSWQELDEQWSMELSHVLCELSLLSQIQGKETPSRDHASDREEAEKFKDLEDLGDNLFKGMELKDLFFIFATKLFVDALCIVLPRFCTLLLPRLCHEGGPIACCPP